MVIAAYIINRYDVLNVTMLC